MNLIIPEIVWHGEKERILSIACHPTTNLLLTGGSDNFSKEDQCEFAGTIRLWEIVNSPQEFIRYSGSLTQHDRPVNCLKFTADGQKFASGSDDYTIIIWEQKTKFKRFGSDEQTFGYDRSQTLIGHAKEVYDLTWSRDCSLIVSCGLDKSICVFSVSKGELLQTLKGHDSYVQGVVMDPRMKSIVSLSQDRTARVWKIMKNNRGRAKDLQFYNAHCVRKLLCPSGNNEQKSYGIFIGETNLFTFVRRPDWSPDGSFFILPAAEYWVDEKPIPGSYIFLRQYPTNPSVFLPAQKPTLVCRFCHKFFKRSADNQNPLIDCPYKMVFAVATIDQVMVYTSESRTPVAVFGNLHFATITDMAFKGSTLICISSCDGFCSFIKIDEGFFGEEIQIEELPEYIRAIFDQKQSVIEVEEEKKEDMLQVQNQQQRVEFRTVDGKQKKHIIPKMVTQTHQSQKQTTQGQNSQAAKTQTQGQHQLVQPTSSEVVPISGSKEEPQSSEPQAQQALPNNEKEQPQPN